jgi:hypothetical protein
MIEDSLNVKITRALLVIAPNAEWSLSGDDYNDLVWLNGGDKPTWARIEAEINNPTPKPEPTISEKLASVGLSLDELKTALLA